MPRVTWKSSLSPPRPPVPSAKNIQTDAALTEEICQEQAVLDELTRGVVHQQEINKKGFVAVGPTEVFCKRATVADHRMHAVQGCVHW